MKKTETKKTKTKKPTVGTKKPFWDGRLRVSTPGYRENYNSIFKQKRNFRGPSKWWIRPTPHTKILLLWVECGRRRKDVILGL